MRENFRLRDGRDQLYIFNISDLHLGSSGCNLKYIDHMKSEIDRLKGPVIINILGDLFECASLRVGDSAFSQIWSVNEQLRYAYKLFAPLKRKSNIEIRNAVPGNHEARLRKDNFDLMESFCDQLKIPYMADTDAELKYIRDEKPWLNKARFNDKIYINDKPLKIFGRHGNGLAKRLDLAMAKQGRDTLNVDADIYVEGHNHRCHFWPQTILTSRDEGAVKWRYNGFTGHFLSYPGGYADKAGFDVLPEAYLRLTVAEIDGKIRVMGQEYFIDRVRPDLWKV
jgi:predicted MPP superfamily phosphohydrolase